LDNNFYGYPLALGLLFNNDPNSRDYLIQEDIHSSGDLHDCVERYKLKE